METGYAVLDQELVQSLRRQRAQLRESMDALEQALAAPLLGSEERWVQRVHVALVELGADLREHITVTEGPDGLYRELLSTAPRLSGAVERLAEEHGAIGGLLGEVMDAAGEPRARERAEEIRDGGTDLLGRLVRHRQRGADLVYQAYQFDIGGET